MSIFYGWKISLLCMGGNFMLQGCALSSMNAFMEPLCDQYGWTRMGLNFSLAIAALCGQIAMPIAAAISASHSLRRLMALGALAGGLATICMGLSSSIYLFTALLVIVWIAAQFCGGVVGNALMSAWFRHYRGIAFSVSTAGTSMSGIFLPLGLLWLIQRYDLRTAYVVLGCVTCVLAPLALRIVRRSPEALHLHPDGYPEEPKNPAPVPANVSLSSLVRRPSAWAIGIAFGLAVMCASGIQSQLKPRFSDLGMESYDAMLLASVGAVSGTLCKFFWGWLCDHKSPIIAARSIMLFCLASLLLAFLPHTPLATILFTVCFCGGTAGLWVVLPALVAHYFGSANFLGVYKFIAIFVILRCLGFPIMGSSYEYFSSYVMADTIFAMCLAISFVLMLALRKSRAVEK